MGIFLLGVIVLCILLFGAKLFVSAETKTLAVLLRRVGGAIVAALALFLLLRGQVVVALAVAGFAIWLFTDGRFRPAIFDMFSKYSGQPGAQGSKPNRRAGNAAMSAKQAREILDVPVGASIEVIKKAHHQLMMKVHPDLGGNSFLAAQINRAKEVLLEEMGER